MALQPPLKPDFCLFTVTDGSYTVKSVLFAMEQVGIGVAYWDFEHHMIYWSKGLAELYSLVSDQFQQTYQDYLRQVYPDDRFELKQVIEQVETTLESGQVEYRVMVDDQERWLRSCFSPAVKDGRLTHIVEVVSDVSDLKSAQRALVNAETRWQKLLGCISDVLIETTLLGEIIFATDSITPLFGYFPDELRGIDLLSVVEFGGSFPLDLSAPIHPDFLPVSAIANFLHKHYSWKTTQCNIHVDTVRQTLVFIFKPLKQTGLTLDASPHLQGAIASVSDALIHGHSLPDLYKTVSDTLADLLPVDCVHIYRYLPGERLWRNVYDYRQRPDLPRAVGYEFPDQDNSIANLLKQLHPLRIDYWEDIDIDPEPDFMTQFSGSWMVLPILVNDSIWGSILVIRFDEDEPWTDQEFNEAILFGDYINLAIAAQAS